MRHFLKSVATISALSIIACTSILLSAKPASAVDSTLLASVIIRLLDTDSHKVNPYLNQGYSRILSGDYKGAIEDFTKALRIDPKLVTAYSNRAFARIRLLQQFWLKPPTENPGDEPRANVCCLVCV